VLKGVHLSLLMGPAVAASRVPAHVIDALVSAQVTSSAGRSGFQLVFAWSKGSPIDRDLQAGSFDPLTRVILVTTVNGTPEVIIDGLVTRQEMSPSDDPGRSTFTLTGEDLSIAMDLVSLTGLIPYPAMPAEARVLLILAKYLIFGVAPLVIPSPLIDIKVRGDRSKARYREDVACPGGARRARARLAELRRGDRLRPARRGALRTRAQAP
jgi:hypothetical protein